ncbi:MAG TPA: VIT1/CCC1 transporter family protein [Candidatus Limnocylindrales bacterium]
MTTPHALRDPRASADPAEHARVARAVLERATVREILMGAQDNLTNVLAVMLGVSIGAGRADLVALAGVSAAVAEAVSMGGVLYSSTRAENALTASPDGSRSTDASGVALSPMASGITTFFAALIGGLVPLVSFVFMPLPAAVATSIALSIVALFALGAATGRISGSIWWRDGIRLLAVAGLAAIAAAVVGSLFRVAE